ncbi:hypothetical protein QAD02_023714 [Eretmocerus hayati]|uniref:Uncharacterized protein n=1 Tax=Eretmocerus hayati TaxID=131215 RepID=A0ACC2PZ21_9HYME|nr:hypothetical protein QAD02_023714 [Eretmocerus hayati]
MCLLGRTKSIAPKTRKVTIACDVSFSLEDSTTFFAGKISFLVLTTRFLSGCVRLCDDNGVGNRHHPVHLLVTSGHRNVRHNFKPIRMGFYTCPSPTDAQIDEDHHDAQQYAAKR